MSTTALAAAPRAKRRATPAPRPTALPPALPQSPINKTAAIVALLAFVAAGLFGWAALSGLAAKPVVSISSTAFSKQQSTERIDAINVGRAVEAENPGEEDDLQFGEVVNPATWRLLVLEATKADGSVCDIELLRPDWWVEEASGAVGGKLYVSVPECGIDDDALVLAIKPCPLIQTPRSGFRTVTGTFRHRNARVLDLHVEGVAEPIGATPNHPFWSDDRHDFVRADKLQPPNRCLPLHRAAATERVGQRGSGLLPIPWGVATLRTSRVCPSHPTSGLLPIPWGVATE